MGDHSYVLGNYSTRLKASISQSQVESWLDYLFMTSGLKSKIPAIPKSPLLKQSQYMQRE